MRASVSSSSSDVITTAGTLTLPGLEPRSQQQSPILPVKLSPPGSVDQCQWHALRSGDHCERGAEGPIIA